MAKKTADPTAAEEISAVEKQAFSAAVSGNAEKKGDNSSGFYIYIGPNIKKHIQTGTVYRGTREDALKRAAAAIEAYPQVKTLIVSGDALPQAYLKVKTPGNILYANYRKLAGKEGN